MPKVRETVSLHPKTVSEAQSHVRRKSGQRQMQNAIDSVKVDLRVWRTAMRLARGDRTRIKVESAESVVVVNQSKKVRCA